MALINAVIQDNESGFYLEGKFSGIEYDVSPIKGGAVGEVKLISLYTNQGGMDIDITTLQLLDITGADVTPADIQERTALLSKYVAKRMSKAGTPTVQTLLSVDGDSVYVKDVDFVNSDFTGWTGTPSDLFISPFSSSLVNAETDNPKQIIIAFNRTVKALQIGLGENNGGDFSNVKISLLGSGGAQRSIFDQSADNTKKTSLNTEFENEVFNSILIEFHTADTVSLSNIIIFKARYDTAQIQGIDADGNLNTVKTTPDGNLTISDNSNGLAISQGNVHGASFLHKFGNAPDFDSSDLEITITDLAEAGTAWELMKYIYSVGNDIDSISSSNAADTGLLMELQGQTIDGIEIIQTVTLNGQNRVAITTPLNRIYRIKNISGTDLLGHVAVYENTALTAGIPTDNTKIRAVVHPENNQTEMAIYRVPEGKTAYLRSWYAATAGANRNTTYIIRLKARKNGGVFQLKHKSALSDLGTSYIHHKYAEPEKYTEFTDIEMTAEISETNKNGASISAGFDIVLIDN